MASKETFNISYDRNTILKAPENPTVKQYLGQYL
jgi:hypothetical protein